MSLHKMKIAITGSGGFLGGELLKELADNNEFMVYALTSQKQKIENEYPFPNIKAIDIKEYDEIDFLGFDVLINCAFPTGSDDAQLAQGLSFIAKALETAVSGGVGAIINISSQSVYSQIKDIAADENTAVIPESKYALAKYTTELLTNAICKDIPHTNIRLASLIGAGFDKRFVNKLVKKAINGEEICIFESGCEKFGFLDVSDAAAGLTALLKKSPQEWKEIYNLGQNGGYSILEIAEAVLKTGKENGYFASQIKVQASDNKHNSLLDCSLFEKDFDWKPKYTLEETIKNIFEYETG